MPDSEHWWASHQCHPPPRVLKTDNGGQFKADTTKELLAEWRVLPLYSPKRHPQYNGGVERANGQLAGYQEALAQFHGRPAGPTCDDAKRALALANELAHPCGWRGPTAGQLWDDRVPIAPRERDAFMIDVEAGRVHARAHWNFPPDAALGHYQAAAVDRRAIRDALLKHDLLTIHSRRQKRTTSRMPAPRSAGTIETTQQALAPPMVGSAQGLCQRALALVRHLVRGGPFLR